MDITLTSLEAEHSALLKAKIASQIASQGGWLPFSRYMEMALYEPGMGYYSAGAHKLGAGGDFTTAPELSPLFGAAICVTLVPVLEGLRQNGLPTQILEFGAGTGKLASSILTRLGDLGIQLDRYDIIEISPDLAQRQQEHIEKTIDQLHLNTQCNWLSQLPKNFKGVILANEVIDAIPCDAIIYQNGFWYWFGVAFELHAPANAWVQQVMQHLEAGLFLTFDYGFPESEYYHPQRLEGTLMAHHRHHAIQDPFHLPGLCDLTTHVEWSQIARSALSQNADDVFLSNQAAYLLDAGIGDIALEIGDPSEPKTFLPISNALQKLLSEAEMGELFKVFACSKNLESLLPNHSLDDLPGLRGRNRL
jgi:SAM-dependent MidA family methyltransferase